MKLTFRIFGVEITTLELELPDTPLPEPTVVAKGAKWISTEFFKRMVR